MSVLSLSTPHGEARAHVGDAEGGAPRAALVLGHGAGGAITAPDLVAVGAAAVAAGITLVLVEQPYRVAGRRNAPPAPTLDAAWTAVLAALRAGPLDGLPVVCGGRSSGARVACRTAAATGAGAVVCLAFPLQPPTRRSGTVPPSRLPELEAVPVPVLVVQGESDRFGMVPDGPGRTVVCVRGDHGLKQDTDAVAAATLAWLDGVLAPGAA